MIEKNCVLPIDVHPESTQCHSERSEESLRGPVSSRFFVASLLRMTSLSTLCARTLIIAIYLTAAACKPIQSVRPSKSEVAKGSCLQLLTYNIRVGAGRDGLLTPVKYLTSSESKLQKIISTIRSLDPDIIGLQEVRGTAQAELLADSLGMNYVYLSHEDSRLDWGLAVLSRFKIIGYYGKFIRYDEKKPRVALVCTIDLGDSSVTVINVHFHLGDYDEQVEETVRLMSSVTGPVILMGDFNLIDPHNGLAPIKKKLADTCEVVDTEYSQEAKEIGTHRYGSKRLDYIFVDPDYFSVLEAGLAPEQHRSASDHIGYFACVRSKSKESDVQEANPEIQQEKAELPTLRGGGGGYGE
jgi:endonuclease/exonuclease/phosphatase family metal-dependent hydrolase